MEEKAKIRLGISIGDLNGIGCEVVLKTFEDPRMTDFCTPIIFASNKTISKQKNDLGIDINYNGIKEVSRAIAGKVNVMNVWNVHSIVKKLLHVSRIYVRNLKRTATLHVRTHIHHVVANVAVNVTVTVVTW